MDAGTTAPSPPEGAALLPLKKRGGEIVAWAVIDAEDYERLAPYHWYRQPSGYVVRNIPHPDGGRNRHGRIRQTQVSLHRAVMGLGYGDKLKVDHKDHDPLNNRKANLRVGTHAQNLQNRRGANRGARSKHRGVSWSKEHKRWSAYARVAGKQHFLGYFEDEDEAARAAAKFRSERMVFATD